VGEKKDDMDICNEKMKDLEAEISKVRLKSAYERAMFLSPKYVQDPAFLRMFLRADLYDSAKAAKRLVNYFENKLLLFGEEKLVKKITLQDLDQDDVDEIGTGSFVFLPQKDRSGRAVCFVSQKNFRYKSWQSKVCRIIDHTSEMG